MLIFKSMAVLQKEKLVVIKKELLHLWHISDFYKSDNNTSGKENQRETISKKLYDDINIHLEYIEDLNKQIDDNYHKYGGRNDEYLSFLTLYNKYNIDIKKLLDTVKLIQSKLMQFQQEHFNQYMPVPNINKRYSSKGFLDYLKDYHTEILKTQDKNIGHPITLWGHTDSFRAHQSLGRSQDIKERYVEIPYWNYEIPFMLPIITHEMGHIVLDYKNNNQSKLLELKNIFLKSDDIKKVFKGNETFLDEILSDVFALLHHDEAYIISLAHELLGIMFSSQFYSQNKNDPVSIHPLDLEDQKFLEGIIRLLTLIAIYNKLKLQHATDQDISIEEKTIKDIQKILTWLIIGININYDSNYEKSILKKLQEIDNTKEGNSLAKIYHSFYGLTDEYINFHYSITKYTDVVIKTFNDSTDSIITIISEINEKIERLSQNTNRLGLYKDVFQELINERMNLLNVSTLYEAEIEFKNKFRRLILKKDGVLKEENEKGSAYELSMFKTRMDRFNNLTDEKTYLDILSDEIKKAHESVLIDNGANKEIKIEPKFTFDYYTILALVKKREKITIENVNKFLTYKKREKTAKYYTNKYSLILLDKIENRKGNGKFSVFINLSLKYNNSKQTIDAIAKLKETMEQESFNQINYEIYKSLGPKEMVIHLHNADIETVYSAKRELFQSGSDIFHRSYTIICFDTKDIDNIEIIPPYHCGSLLRAKTGTKDKDFKDEEDNIHSILMTTGIKDYTIQWKPKTQMKKIINYYNELAKHEKCTDVQTFLMKRIEENDKKQ